MTRPTKEQIEGDRFLFVPCENATGLAVVWDRVEQCVVDVVDAQLAADYAVIA